jgi:hypothetical protein
VPTGVIDEHGHVGGAATDIYQNHTFTPLFRSKTGSGGS